MPGAGRRRRSRVGLASFPGVAHRLEVVAEIGGVRYVNDSKATNPDAAIAALDAYPARVHLIAGGRAKGTPFAPLADAARGVVVRAYLVGEASGEIAGRSRGEGIPAERVATIAEAVAAAAAGARAGDVVLLAPACTSFDQYSSFEERGEDFRAAVHGLPERCPASKDYVGRRKGPRAPGVESQGWCPLHRPTWAKGRGQPDCVKSGTERMLLGAVVFLVCLGLLMVYSVSSARAVIVGGDPAQPGPAPAHVRDARVHRARARRPGARGLLPASRPGRGRGGDRVLLVMVLECRAIGVVVNGAKRWLAFGPMQLAAVRARQDRVGPVDRDGGRQRPQRRLSEPKRAHAVPLLTGLFGR